MKKIIPLIFTLALFNNIWSQTGAKCIYKITVNNSVLDVSSADDKLSKDTKNMLNSALNLAKRFEYTLDFNNNESIFQLNRLMIEDNKSDYLFPIAKAIIGQGVYYQNKIENENIQQHNNCMFDNKFYRISFFSKSSGESRSNDIPEVRFQFDLGQCIRYVEPYPPG